MTRILKWRTKRFIAGDKIRSEKKIMIHSFLLSLLKSHIFIILYRAAQSHFTLHAGCTNLFYSNEFKHFSPTSNTMRNKNTSVENYCSGYHR